MRRVACTLGRRGSSSHSLLALFCPKAYSMAGCSGPFWSLGCRHHGPKHCTTGPVVGTMYEHLPLECPDEKQLGWCMLLTNNAEFSGSLDRKT
ncbi:hypothetical protein F5Y15DRAFT_326996 [Xylariaceae sp. FL0016]|nr:hypothetical protein F5Y15DRAFT_326996 [Xylariaceae sp. FL0016]